jgi:type II secretory pathway component PulJ
MGKLKEKANPQGGYVLIDVMIALVITGIAFVFLFGAISLSTRNTARIRERLSRYIERKNDFAETREIDFIEK